MQQRTPYATLLLLLVALVTAYFTLGNSSAGITWGFIPQPLAPVSAFERLLTAATSLFVHVDPIHLLANMIVLAGIGPAIEKATGSLKFLIVFLVAGLVGVGVHWLVAITAMRAIGPEPTFGASGAIAGLIGYAWLRFYRVRIPISPGRFVPLWSLVLVWVALQVAGGIYALSKFGIATAYWAHLGGFAAGFVLAYLLKAHSEAADEAWEAHLQAGRSEGANASATAARTALEARPNDVAALQQLFRASLAMGDEAEAAVLLERLLAADSSLAVSELKDTRLLTRTDIGRRARAADEVAAKDPHAAEVLWQSILEEQDGPQTPHALVGLISISEPGSARVYASRLASDFALSPQAEMARNKWPELFDKR